MKDFYLPLILLLAALAAAPSAHAIVGGTEDTADQIRSVVMVGGCSGTLISDRIVLTAAHCFGRQATGCSAPYSPEQPAFPPGDLSAAVTVKIPAPGETEFGAPGEERYFVEGFRTMPAYTWDVVETCCGGILAGCDFCPNAPGYPDTNFDLAGVATQVHDIAVVYLDRPVQGIVPEEVLYDVGPTATYPVDPPSLVGTHLVMAGTSRASSDPTRKRAFGVAELTGMADSDTVAEPQPVCSLSGQSIVTYSGPESTFQYQPGSTGTACSVPGDSGGPHFVNAVGLGGSSVTGIPTGKRLIAALVSGGSYGATDNCNAVSHLQAALTYNFEYIYDGNPVLGQNGDFIRDAIKDFDDDGIPNETDNCPTVINYDQANCNADAEIAWGYSERGDACDPTPCAHAWPEPSQYAVTSSYDGSFIKIEVGLIIREDFDIDPRPSKRFYNGSNDGEDEGDLNLNQVPTKYRFCQVDPVLNVHCGNQTIDNGFASLANGPVSPQRPYLRINMKDSQGQGPSFDEELLGYGPSPQILRRWDYAADSSSWQNNGWITAVGGSFPASTNLDGRYWVHSDTDIGRHKTPIGPTGYPAKIDGTASTDDQHLSNHYRWHAPDAAYSLHFAKELIPWPYFDWKIDWTLADSLGPVWGGEYFEDAKVIASEGGHYALVTPDGQGLVIDEYLGDGLKELMADEGVVWVSAAEASPDQAHRGSHESPHALAFAAEGAEILDGVYRIENQAGSSQDIRAEDLRRPDGPSPRSRFVGVYSRADDLAFVVGDGEVWFRPVVGEGPWQQSPPSEGYEPATVLAATWSFRDQKLWILDTEDGIARLTRLHPTTGFAEQVYAWDYSGRFDQQWLRVALDGNVLLFSSSTEGQTHGIARFQSEPLKPGAAVTVAALHLEDRNLLYEPTVDRRGVSLALPGERGGIQLLRHHTIPGRATALEDLRALFE